MVTELEMKYRRLSRNYDELEEKYEAAQEELKNIINRQEGFVGTGLKKDEFVCNCSDLDDIIFIFFFFYPRL